MCRRLEYRWLAAQIRGAIAYVFGPKLNVPSGPIRHAQTEANSLGDVEGLPRGDVPHLAFHGLLSESEVEQHLKAAGAERSDRDLELPPDGEAFCLVGRVEVSAEQAVSWVKVALVWSRFSQGFRILAFRLLNGVASFVLVSALASQSGIELASAIVLLGLAWAVVHSAFGPSMLLMAWNQERSVTPTQARDRVRRVLLMGS